MADYWTFAGHAFYGGGDVGSYWKPALDATDRPLAGTDRFERTINSRKWTIDIDAWIDADTTAKATFEALQTLYSNGTIETLVPPNADGVSWTAVIITFAVQPVESGLYGYRGTITFGRQS